LDRYARLETADGARLAGYVEASRGCLHHCRHCPIPPVYGGRFFVVPVDVVVADASAQIAAGARHLTLGDPDFLNGPKHALAVARALHAAHPDVTFDVTVKIEHILRHSELFAELGALGCAFVVSAVESLSDRVLAILDKGHTRADVDAALAILDEARVPLRPTFVPFTPWSTLDDYLALVDWIDARGMVEHVDPIQLAIRLLIPPGSLLLAHPETLPHLGALEPAKLSYAWTHPDPRMDRLAHEVFAAVEGGATFADVRALAEAAASRSPHAARTAPLEHKTVRGRPPRLSESWFC
ncbi:MAG TPA: radical SAM protein, partial [Polyangia bacterium]